MISKLRNKCVRLFQIYPFPIPDLFCGNSLTISGKFQGSFPDSITVFGLMPDHSTWTVEVPSRKTFKVPLSKVSSSRGPAATFDTNCKVLCVFIF